MQNKDVVKGNPNYVVTNRHWVAIKRHAPVVFSAMCCGTALSFIQLLINKHHLSFQNEAKDAILFIPFAFISFVYVIFAGYAVNKVLDESKEVSKAVIKGDLDTFLIYRDEQLPILVHLPLGASSGIIVLFALFFPFPGEAIAIASVFSVVFMMTLLFLVTMELDNYENSIWFKEETPSEWWQINIKEYFTKKNSKAATEKAD